MTANGTGPICSGDTFAFAFMVDAFTNMRCHSIKILYLHAVFKKGFAVTLRLVEAQCLSILAIHSI